MAVYRVITLLAVVFANVMFRAPDVATSLAIWRGMLRLDLVGELPAALPTAIPDLIAEPLALSLVAIFIIACMPNTQQFLGRYSPVLHWGAWRHVAPSAISLRWRPTIGWGLAMAVLAFLAIAFVSRGQSAFIYFNF